MSTTGRVTLLALNNAGFKTSKHADQMGEKLRKALGLTTRYEPARLAIARSLAISDPPPPLPEAYREEECGAIKGQNLFGDDLAIWTAMVVEHAGKGDTSLKEIQEMVRLHWHRGMELLMKDWEESGGGDHDDEQFDKFVLLQASRAGIREGGKLRLLGAGSELESKAAPVVLRLGEVGTDTQTQQPVRWILNGPGESPHVAIMGKIGSGKTRTGMDLIRQIRKQTGCPVLLFDMAKGDLAANAGLIHELEATVIRAPKEPIPLDVLHIAERVQADAHQGAMRFRDSFKSMMQSKPGGKQLDALREGAYRALLTSKPVKIQDVRDKVREVYSERRQKDDVVTATFNELTAWDLFEPRLSPQQFFSKSWIIDLHEATSETEQRLLVFLLLDALYTHYRTLPDSTMDETGHRALRICVGIDEARRVLGYGQPSLIALVRESRSKGTSLVLMSQSPDDFDSEDDNFLESIGLAMSFNTSAPRARALQAFLGQNVDLGGLQSGVAVTRLKDRPGIIRVKAW
jgi:DNA sulfur modification protein DndE